MLRVCSFCKNLIKDGNSVYEGKMVYLHEKCFQIKQQKDKSRNDVKKTLTILISIIVVVAFIIWLTIIIKATS